MEKVTISVVNTIGDVFGVEAEDGQKVFELITKVFDEKKEAILSFQNIEILTTAFLNTAVGQLYSKYSEDFIKENLTITNISELGRVALRRVVDTAKLFYKDPEALKRSIAEISED